MTRDEATKLVSSLISAIDANKCPIEDRAYLATECFVALGILKLDEPKSALERLAEGLDFKTRYVQIILDRCGLKVVEK